jgi:hypothetical protein
MATAFPALQLIRLQIVARQLMALGAVPLANVSGGQRVATKSVDTVRDGLHVHRVAAHGDAAQMIDGQLSWNVSDEPRVS